ncbi:MAG: hypothetical protein ACR2LZ_11770 [Pyrinomonadaceae bacterium]
MADQKDKQGGFPQNQTTGQDTHSTTGDGHPPRPGERQTQENMAGQGTGQMGDSQQKQGQGTSAGGGQKDSGNK